MADDLSPKTKTSVTAADNRRHKGLMFLVGFVGFLLLSWMLFVLSPEVRMIVAGGLGRLGPWAMPMVHHFLDDDNGHVQRVATEALMEAGSDAVPTLRNGLASGNPSRRIHDLHLLFHIGTNASAAIPDLIEVIANDPDEEVRRVAIMALAAVGKESTLAVHTLAKTLQDSHSEIRSEAATALGRMGRNAMDAIPALAKSLQDPDASVRQKTAVALGNIGPEPQTIQALIGALEDPSSDVRAEAAESLGGFGAESKQAVVALARCLKDPETRVRQEAAEALGKIGPDARAAIPSLQEALRDPVPAVANEASSALRSIGD